MHDPSDSTGSILFELTDQLAADLEAGELQPLAHYLGRFPGHEEHVAREYLEWTHAPRAADAAPASRQIGPYRLAEVLGRGGQGVVYRAEDVRLERTVALKVLTLPVASVSQGRRNRFRREAEIVSRLDHPGICTVLEVDLDGETPYIAMRFVEGETLAAALARTRADRSADPTPAPDGDTSTSASRLLHPRRALELSETLAFFERVARALHAAHEAGVVHRDIKPGNIMVSKDGAPVILDFGLARVEEEASAQLTRSGEVFGTPAYISPEQLKSGRDVDRRTDVYSLGVVLYECLTLERPFQADSSAALVRAIQSAALPPPRRHNPALPQDLAVVLETALEKDVGRRYPTAIELAEELRRVREYEPIRARPAGPLRRLQRWTQRNPVVATATIGSIATLSIALFVALVLLRRVNDEKLRKEAALQLYEGAWYRDQAVGTLSYSPARSLHLAIAASERDPGLASNRVLLDALDSLWEKQMLVGHVGIVTHVDIDRASKRALTASHDGTARVWDVESGAELHAFRLSDGPVLCARFSPDGDHLVACGQGAHAAVWSTLRPDAPPVRLAGHAGDVHWAEFSPDGARVVTASRDRTARIWDAADGRELARLEQHEGCVAEARFLGQGAFVLTRSADPPLGAAEPESDFTARLFDARTGACLRVFAGHAAAIVCMATSPDERWLVTASEDRTARLWRLDGDPAAGPERVFDAPGKFHHAAFSPDGRRLALAFDAGARVVDPQTGEVAYELPSHAHRAVVRAIFSPDGERLATVAYDDALRLFRARDGALLRLCRGETRQVVGLAWSPDASFLATWQRHAAVDLWYGAERPFLQVLRGHEGEVRSACFDRTGDRVLTASADGTARTWNAATGASEQTFDAANADGERRPLIAARFDPAEERILTTDESGRVLLFDIRDRKIVGREEGGGPTSPTNIGARFSPDGAKLCLSSGDGSVCLVELASGRRRRFRAHEGGLDCFAFSPDGAQLATGGEDRCVCLWDARFTSDAPEESVEPIWRSAPFASEYYKLKSVFDVAFSPDGRWIAAACQNLRIGLYDARDGQLSSEGTVATPGRLCFSPDGRFLFGTSKYYNFATLWRLEGGGRIVREPLPADSGSNHTNSMTSIAAARLVPWMVTGSLDRTIRLWDLERRECIACYGGHADRILDADISPDGQRIVSASGDGTARLWPGDLLGTARRSEPAAVAKSFGALPRPEKRR